MPSTGDTPHQPHQPHDKLFKLAFGNPETAAGLLSAELPPALAAAIDWKSLHPQAGTFTDTRSDSRH